MNRKASNSLPVQRLRHHVTGAIERGETQAIAGIPAIAPETFPVRMLQTIRHAGNVCGFVWLEGETYSATLATNQPEANRVFIFAPTGEEISATLGEDCVRVAPETAQNATIPASEGKDTTPQASDLVATVDSQLQDLTAEIARIRNTLAKLNN